MRMNEKPCACGAPGCIAVRRPKESVRDFVERRKYASPACAGSNTPMSRAELAVAAALQAEGLSLRAIGRRMGRKNTSVQRALYRYKNPAAPAAKLAPVERPSRDAGASDRLLHALRRHPRPVELTGAMLGRLVLLPMERGCWA
jgi:hypothetical protein